MIQFYKPNAKVTGTACSFWLNRDNSVMASMIKQASWNSDRKIGSFAKNKDNPKKRVIVKLSRLEVAAIMDSIQSNRELSTYHRSQNQVLQIKFCPYVRDEQQVGFSFSVNKQEKEDSTARTGFIIGFTFPEAKLLSHDLGLFLDQTSHSQEDNREDEVKAPTPQPSPLKVTDLEEEGVLDQNDDEPW